MTIHAGPIILAILLVALGGAIFKFETSLVLFELELYRTGPRPIRVLLAATVNLQRVNGAEPLIRRNVRASGIGAIVAGLVSMFVGLFS